MTLRLKILLVTAVTTAIFAFVTENPSSIATPSFPNKIVKKDRVSELNVNTSKQIANTTKGTISLLKVIPRDTLIAKKLGTETQVDLFNAASWSPEPQPTLPVVTTPTPPREVAPPLNFRFIGKAIIDGQLNIFLSNQEQTFVVMEGQSINANYKVGKIQPPTMELIYLPLNEMQTLFIGNTN